MIHFQEQQVHDSDELAGDIQLEEQLSKNTAQYNKLLTEQPSNVELWLKYVQFQVFPPIICFINLVDTSHALSGMYFVMYSFTTHNLSIYTQLFNPLNAELNSICHLLALVGAHHIFHVSGLRVNISFTG